MLSVLECCPRTHGVWKVLWGWGRDPPLFPWKALQDPNAGSSQRLSWCSPQWLQLCLCLFNLDSSKSLVPLKGNKERVQDNKEQLEGGEQAGKQGPRYPFCHPSCCVALGMLGMF